MVESVELLVMTIGLEKAFVKPSSKGSSKTIANGEHGEKQMFHWAVREKKKKDKTKTFEQVGDTG